MSQTVSSLKETLDRISQRRNGSIS